MPSSTAIRRHRRRGGHLIDLSRLGGLVYNSSRYSIVFLAAVFLALTFTFVRYSDNITSTPWHIFWTIPENIFLGTSLVAMTVLIPWLSLPLLFGLRFRSSVRIIRRKADWQNKRYILLALTALNLLLLAFMTPFIVISLKLAGFFSISWIGLATSLSGVVIDLILRLRDLLRHRHEVIDVETTDFPELMKPQNTEVLNLDIGALAPRLNVVVDALDAWTYYAEMHAPTSTLVWKGVTSMHEDDLPAEWTHHLRASAWRGVERLRESLAELVTALPDQIILVTSTTRAIEVALESIQPKVLVMSDIEHDSENRIAECLSRKIGTLVHRVQVAHKLSSGKSLDLVAEFVNACENVNADALLISHVLYANGVILPVEDITKQLKSRRPHCRVVVDGAHAIGLINVDINAIGSDYYAFSGHKWLFGPPALGILVGALSLRNEPPLLDRLKAEVHESLAFRTSITTEEGSTISLVPFVGLAASLFGMRTVGFSDVLQNIRALRALFEYHLQESRFVERVRLSNVSTVPGIVNVQRKESTLSHQELINARNTLEDKWKIITKVVKTPMSLRLCLPFYLSRGDIVQSIKALDSVLSLK